MFDSEYLRNKDLSNKAHVNLRHNREFRTKKKVNHSELLVLRDEEKGI